MDMAAASTSRPSDEHFELQDTTNAQNENNQSGQEFSLPPADGGKDAWLFLLTCFVVEIFVWGKQFCSP